MLNLDRRSATIGAHVNGRVQKHGQEDVPALDIELSGIVIGEKDLNSLCGDPHTAQAFFDPPGKQGRMAMPRFPKLEPFRFREKVKGCNVSIWLDGKDTPIVLTGCSIAKIELNPKEGGTTLLSCQVQAVQPGEKVAGKLHDQMNHGCSVEIVEAQEDLAEKAAA